MLNELDEKAILKLAGGARAVRGWRSRNDQKDR